MGFRIQAILCLFLDQMHIYELFQLLFLNIMLFDLVEAYLDQFYLQDELSARTIHLLQEV